jgi:hypothetical protein
MLHLLYQDLAFIASYDEKIRERLKRTVEVDQDSFPTEAAKQRFRDCIEVVVAHLHRDGPRLGDF